MVAVLALAAPAFGQVDAKVEKELQASYAKLVAAMKKKDVKGVIDRMTPDAKMKEGKRIVTRAQLESQLNMQLGMMDLQSSQLKFTKLAAKGDTAKSEYTETMKMKVQFPGDKEPAIMTSTGKYRTTFKKVGGDWKMQYSENVGAPKMLKNGKPFSLQPMTPSAGAGRG
jgi:ketosteroid isomerase-like protein